VLILSNFWASDDPPRDEQGDSEESAYDRAANGYLGDRFVAERTGDNPDECR
jgi:hypothetical protein